MAWKRIRHDWPFVRGIHRLPVDSPPKGPVMRCFDDPFGVSLNDLPKQPRGRWTEMAWRSFDVIVMKLKMYWRLFMLFHFSVIWLQTRPCTCPCWSLVPPASIATQGRMRSSMASWVKTPSKVSSSARNVSAIILGQHWQTTAIIMTTLS